MGLPEILTQVRDMLWSEHPDAFSRKRPILQENSDHYRSLTTPDPLTAPEPPQQLLDSAKKKPYPTLVSRSYIS